MQEYHIFILVGIAIAVICFGVGYMSGSLLKREVEDDDESF